jgi:hypothetical protein
MTRSQKWFVLIVTVLFVVGLGAQQQQSGGGGGGNMNLATVGGSNVTLGSKTSANSIPVVIASDNAAQAVAVNAGSNIIGKVGIDQTTPGTTNGVSVTNASIPVTQSGTWGVNINASQAVGLNAGTNVIGKVVPATSCGATAFSQAWAAVPTVATSVTATTTCVQAIIFTNTNASAQTVNVTDGQGSPVTVIATYSIPGNSQVTFPFFGAAMTTGVKWSAGGAGVTGAVIGWQ